MKSLLCAIAGLINALAALHLGLLAMGVNILAKVGLVNESPLMGETGAEMVTGLGKYILIVVGISGLLGLFGAIQWMRGCHRCNCESKPTM